MSLSSVVVADHVMHPVTQPMAPTRTPSADELAALLGHSIKSKQLRALMRALGLTTSPCAELDAAGEAYEARATKRGITLTFDGYRRYRRAYGKPASIADPTKDELVLVEIELLSERIAWPFGLERREPAAKLVAKLGKRPYEKDASVDYGHAWWFRFDDYRVLAALDARLRLLWLRMVRLTTAERAKHGPKQRPSRPAPKLRLASMTAIRAAGAKLPTVRWQRRMASGDTTFKVVRASGVKVAGDLTESWRDW